MIKINQNISLIIPAYNEAKNIEAVLKPLSKIKWIDEVIVVDDNSSDSTAKIATKYPVKVISHKENLGKGGAMATGIAAAKYDLLLFLDADLTGLCEDHLIQILSPVMFTKEADLCLGVFSLGNFSGTNIANRSFPAITGQRVIWRSFLPPISRIKNSRYGVDLLITKFIPRKRRAVVKLTGLSQVVKEEKSAKFLEATRARVKMYREIMRTMKEIRKESRQNSFVDIF